VAAFWRDAERIGAELREARQRALEILELEELRADEPALPEH
jgi:hypothetical protein